MDVSTPPSLDPLASSEKPIPKNMSTCFEREVLIKTKYGHSSLMLIIIIAKTLSYYFII